MHKVIVDTNVFISGVVYGGNPRKIIQLWHENKYIFCLSPELKAEILGKLKRKFLLPKESLQNIEESLDAKSKKYIPKNKITICKDPQENFLIELAEEAKANYIISGDKLVLKLEQYKGTRIIAPREFIDNIK